MSAVRSVNAFIDIEGEVESLPCTLAETISQHGQQNGVDDNFWIDAVDDVLIVAVTDLAGTIIYANERFCAISGYAQSELIGANHRILNSRTHDADFFKDMFRTIQRGETWRGEICNRAKDGHLYWVATTIIPRLNERGSVTHYVACRFDISEQKRAQQNLVQAANTDALTGLLNRFAFQNRLEACFRSTREVSKPAALAMIDIDSFKDINDIYGHQTGDELLKIVAKRIQKVAEPGDVIARFGGDEMVIFLNDLCGESDLNKRLDRIQAIIQQPIELEGAKNQVYASIGVALYPKDGADTVDLFKKADMALYNAKRLGRNRYEYYSAILEQNITTRVRLQEEARLGLLRGEFCLHYQPILNLHTGKIDNMEALLRWNHRRLGFITPGQFWDVFDDMWLTAKLGCFVRKTVVQQAAQWAKNGVPFGRIAINTTAADFVRPGLTIELLTQLTECGLNASAIAIEVTEGMFLGKQSGRVREELTLLHKAGFEIAFDDFGTGFASLTHLKELPLNRIKIDRSFVKDMLVVDADRKIVKGIIDLSHSLGLIVTAEGIECDGQLEMLRDMGCDRIQGYLISKPLSPDDLAMRCCSEYVD